MFKDGLTINDGPVAIRWPKTEAPHVTWDEVGQGLAARRISTTSAKSEICILGAGKMLATAVAAAQILEDEGRTTTVWDPRIIRPLDPVMLDDAADHSLVITIEDGLREGGFGSAVRDVLADNASNCRVLVMGVPLGYYQHDQPDSILSSVGLDPAGVVRAVQAHLE